MAEELEGLDALLEAHAPPRLTREPLPAYRHLPGDTAHPVRHPEGHSHEEETAEPEGTVSEHALRGADLYNRWYFWEAHEAWEQAWILAGRQGRAADLVQGLVQVAAAMLKTRLGNRRGAMRLADRGMDLLRKGELTAGEVLPGWDPAAFRLEIAEWFAGVAAGRGFDRIDAWPWLRVSRAQPDLGPA